MGIVSQEKNPLAQRSEPFLSVWLRALKLWSRPSQPDSVITVNPAKHKDAPAWRAILQFMLEMEPATGAAIELIGSSPAFCRRGVL